MYKKIEIESASAISNNNELIRRNFFMEQRTLSEFVGSQ
ncbi:MAG: hypothetical protein RL097_703 [Candidatus Parcubacteria bacterium]